MKFLFLCMVLLTVLLASGLIVIRLVGGCNKDSKKASKERIAFLLLLSISVVFIYRNFIFGNSVYAFNDIGSDTTQQYLPLYIDLIHDICSGDISFWNSNFGMGSSRLTYQSIYFDPFNAILIPMGILFGDSFLPGILLTIQILKMAVCGLIFLRLSAFYCENSYAKVFGSWLYSCNGYLSLWGNHYFLGTSCVFFVLILLFIELHLANRTRFSFVCLSLSVAALLSWSVYIAFMILLQAAVYAVLRCVFLYGSARESAKKFLSLVFPVVVGILIGCIVAIPVACLLLFDSVRIASSVSTLDKAISYLCQLPSLDFMVYAISRFMGNNYISVGTDLTAVSNYYELPQIGCSAAFFSFLILYILWMCRERLSSRQKIAIVAAFAISIFYFADCFIPGLLNVFAGVSYRGSFVFACFGALMIAFVSDKIALCDFYKKKDYIAAVLPSLALLICFFALGSESARMLSIFSFFAILLATISLLMSDDRGRRIVYLCVALVAVGSTSVADAYVTENFRNPLTSQAFPSTDNVHKGQSSAALDYVLTNDDSVFRIDKTFAEWSVFQDGLIQGYDGVTSYNSTRPKEEIQFLSNLWPDNSDGSSEHVYTSYSSAPDNAGPVSLLGIKYILSGQEMDYDWLSLVNVVDSIYIYENISFKSFALGYHSSILSNDVELFSAEDKNACIESGCAVVEDSSSLLRGRPSPADEYIVRKKNAGEYELRLSEDEDTLVTLAIANSPGWMVDVDGVVSQASTANYGLVSTVVSQGNHTVRFYYVPYGLNVGAGFAGIGILILLAAFALLSKRYD